MSGFKETGEQMKNKVIDIYLFKFATTGIIHEGKKPLNRNEPIRGESLTRAAAHKPPGQCPRTTALTCLNYGQCSLFNNKTETGQKWHLWEKVWNRSSTSGPG